MSSFIQRKNNMLPPSPRHLVVVSKMKRKYKGKNRMVKEGDTGRYLVLLSNVNFHLIEKCIKRQNPYFKPSLVCCPKDLKDPSPAPTSPIFVSNGHTNLNLNHW